MIKVFFGAPGCGKSTLTAYLAQKHYKNALKFAKKGQSYRYNYIFSNTEIKNADLFKRDNLNNMVFPRKSLALIDEAGIDFNSRKTLAMTDGMQQYLKKHRHYDNDIYFFSQSWEDIDIVVSRLASEIWHCKKLGPFTLCRRILKDTDVNDESKKIEDVYKKQKLYKRLLPFPFGSFSFFIIYRPKYYHLFDSWEVEEKPFIKGTPIVGSFR